MQAGLKQGFHKLECSKCNCKTWHYKEASATSARCTEHLDCSKCGKTWYGDHVYCPDCQKEKLDDINNNIVITARMTEELPKEADPRELKIANRLDRTPWMISEERRIADTAQVLVEDSEQWVQREMSNFPKESDTPRDPGKIYCSFCGVEIDQLRVTTERKPTIKITTEAYKDDNGEIHLVEKYVSKVETIHACPEHCLQIRKPIAVRIV